MTKTDQQLIAEAISRSMKPLAEDELWSDEKHGPALEKTRRMEFAARQERSRDKIDAQKAKLQISEPNSSGQGKSPLHSQHAHHETLAKHGYAYSHTTPVISQSEKVMAHHTYNHPDHKMPTVGVTVHPEKGEVWSGGHKSVQTKMGRHSADLHKYLGGAAKRAKSKA